RGDEPLVLHAAHPLIRGVPPAPRAPARARLRSGDGEARGAPAHPLLLAAGGARGAAGRLLCLLPGVLRRGDRLLQLALARAQPRTVDVAARGLSRLRPPPDDPPRAGAARAGGCHLLE